jgi:hypothetical protein
MAIPSSGKGQQQTCHPETLQYGVELRIDVALTRALAERYFDQRTGGIPLREPVPPYPLLVPTAFRHFAYRFHSEHPQSC